MAMHFIYRVMIRYRLTQRQSIFSYSVVQNQFGTDDWYLILNRWSTMQNIYTIFALIQWSCKCLILVELYWYIYIYCSQYLFKILTAILPHAHIPIFCTDGKALQQERQIKLLLHSTRSKSAHNVPISHEFIPVIILMAYCIKSCYSIVNALECSLFCIKLSLLEYEVDRLYLHFYTLQTWPLLLTWFNFNPNMDK